MGNLRYQRDGDPRTSGPGFGVTLHRDKLEEPLGWRRPRLVFVNSMSDLFHPKVPEMFIAQVFATMALTPRHTYQILTKRHARMPAILGRLVPAVRAALAGRGDQDGFPWPLPNVWLGVSVEDQRLADARIPRLLETPAAIRFLSCEPLLGPLSLSPWLIRPGGIHWVIAGGESGSHMWQVWPDRGLAMPNGRRWFPRPDRVAWVRAVMEECRAASVPFFLKQWGGPHPKAAGDELDGKEWREFPAGVSLA